MDQSAADEIRLTASECARRMGLSVRTVRVYERHGLIKPKRTGKDWRLYGANEMTRLNEVLASRPLGSVYRASPTFFTGNRSISVGRSRFSVKRCRGFDSGPNVVWP
jgi:MerR-like DNA binding protein